MKRTAPAFLALLALLLGLLLHASSAFALVSPVYQWWPESRGQSSLYGSPDAACAAGTPPANSLGPSSPTRVSDTEYACKWLVPFNGGTAVAGSDTARRTGSQACPANSTAVTGGCQCNTNYDESNGQCVPHTNQCTAKTGQVGILSWTEGYTRTPDEGDRQAVGPVMSPPPSGEVCDSGCSVSLQTSGPGVQPYVSQYPTANGLYRRSVDYPSLGLGKECTAGAADAGAKKDAPAPDCPGSVGDLGNGKPVCVGTAAKPITPTPLGGAPGATPIAGNPAAGAKPPSGEGSGTGSAGRTPTTGNGTAAGGPSAAGVGGKGGGAGGTAAGVGTGGSGTGDEPHKPCGGPGEPTCNVKVDETGVPAAAGTSFDSAKAKMDETKTKNDEQLQKAAGTGDKGFFEPLRSMFWAPPVAACETFDLPQQVGGLKLDACGVVDGVRNAMALVWAGAGLFLCFGMIKRSF